MILTGSPSLEGLCHVMLGGQGWRSGIIVRHDGKRYGGFSSGDHALFVIREMQWTGATIEIQEPVISVDVK